MISWRTFYFCSTSEHSSQRLYWHYENQRKKNPNSWLLQSYCFPYMYSIVRKTWSSFFSNFYANPFLCVVFFPFRIDVAKAGSPLCSHTKSIFFSPLRRTSTNSPFSPCPFTVGILFATHTNLQYFIRLYPACYIRNSRTQQTSSIRNVRFFFQQHCCPSLLLAGIQQNNLLIRFCSSFSG